MNEQTPPMKLSEFLTTDDLVKELKVKPAVIDRWVRHLGLPAIKVNKGQRIFHEDAVTRWLKSREVALTASETAETEDE